MELLLIGQTAKPLKPPPLLLQRQDMMSQLLVYSDSSSLLKLCPEKLSCCERWQYA